MHLSLRSAIKLSRGVAFTSLFAVVVGVYLFIYLFLYLFLESDVCSGWSVYTKLQIV